MQNILIWNCTSLFVKILTLVLQPGAIMKSAQSRNADQQRERTVHIADIMEQLLICSQAKTVF